MHSTFWHYYRGKIRNYQRGSQYPPGKEKKKYDGSRKWTKRQIKCWLNLRLLKAKVRMKVKSEEERKSKNQNGFSEAARGYFNCSLYFLRNFLLSQFCSIINVLHPIFNLFIYKWNRWYGVALHRANKAIAILTILN